MFKFLGVKPPVKLEKPYGFENIGNVEHFRGALLEAAEVVGWPEYPEQVLMIIENPTDGYEFSSNEKRMIFDEWLQEKLRVSAGEE